MADGLRDKHLNRLPAERLVLTTTPAHRSAQSDGRSVHAVYAASGRPAGWLSAGARRAVFAKAPGRVSDSDLSSAPTPATLPPVRPAVAALAGTSPLRTDALPTNPVDARRALRDLGLRPSPPGPAEAAARAPQEPPAWLKQLVVWLWRNVILPALIDLALFLLRLLVSYLWEAVRDLANRYQRWLKHQHEVLDEPGWCPRIEAPMYRALDQHARDYLVPQLQSIPDNSVVFFQENRRFIEAFLVGVNHELIREMVWREVPVDRHGTVVQSFWDSDEPGRGAAYIKPIRAWTTTSGDKTELAPLGQNAPDGGAVAAGINRLIVALKGDLVRTIPRPLSFLVNVPAAAGATALADALDHLFDPVPPAGVYRPDVHGVVGDGVLLLGFPTVDAHVVRAKPDEWYFVISEQPTLPRFGLDARRLAPRLPGAPLPPTELDNVSWDYVVHDRVASRWILQFESFELPELKPRIDPDTLNSNMVASLTLQKPTRLVFSFKAMER